MLLQWKRLIQIELRNRLSALRLFHVGHLVENRRSALSLSWHEWSSGESKEWKIYSATGLEYETFWRHLADYVKMITPKSAGAARAARLFFLIQPIKSMIWDVVAAIAVIISQTPY